MSGSSTLSIDLPVTSGPQMREHLRAYADTERNGDDVSKAICTVEGCEKPRKTRGWCSMHYYRWRKYGDLGFTFHRGTRIPQSQPKPAKPPCSIEGCDKPSKGRGWCGMHYMRWQQHGDPLFAFIRGKTIPLSQQVTVCTVEGCDRAPISKGWCSMHYTRWRRNGVLDDPELRKSPLEEFLERVHKTDDGCWTWIGVVNNKGYGRLGSQYAHRFSYEAHHGPIPEGLHILHRCDNPPCVNPDHLWVGTAADNMRDASAKGRIGGCCARKRTQP